LFWQGFGVIGGNFFVHPSADLSAAFDALIAEGLADLLGKLKPLLAADAQFGNAANDVDMVHGAWNLERLAGMYAEFVERYQPVLAQLRADVQVDIDGESAFLLRTLLIHDYRRLLLRDPGAARRAPPRRVAEKARLAGLQKARPARLLCKEVYRRLSAGPARLIPGLRVLLHFRQGIWTRSPPPPVTFRATWVRHPGKIRWPNYGSMPSTPGKHLEAKSRC
jgi:phenylacetic acid degradation operon negative regulatory protein